MRRFVVGLPFALVFAALAAAGASKSTASPQACAPETAMRPYLLGAESTLDEGLAVTTHPLRVSFDFRAAADGSYASIDDKSLTVSGPQGVHISPADDPFVRIVTGAGAGTVRLELSWVQGATYDNPECSASGEVSFQVREAKPALVHVYPRGQVGRFEMIIKRGRGGDASPVRLIVRSKAGGTRCCRGSQKWPRTPRRPKRGKALMDARVAMGVPAPGTVSGLKRRDRAVTAHLFRFDDYALDVEPCCAYGPRFKRTTLAFTITARQSGRRIGWMSTGLRCLVRRGGSGLICYRVGFRKGP
jgi:hypothetical protein